MYKIGIIGNGFVGSSVAFGFSSNTGCDVEDVKIYDKDNSKSTHTLDKVVNDSDYIFLSVPTPSNQDGSISLDIIYDVFKDIDNIIDYEQDFQPVILLRSTVTPGTTKKIQMNYPRLHIVFNPEFLTERSAKLDFINQARIVLGGNWGDTIKVEHLYTWRFGNYIPVIKTDFETAELIKYMCNCFFATKVSYLNEMKQLSDKIGAKWKDCVDGFSLDGRIGHSHLNVPGPDGKFGFGGSCFPKDVQAMIKFMDGLDVPVNTLKGAWETNLKVRPEQDWKKLKGRAVVDENK
jgi:UDPglucose 6-dehydrogenase|tara:strand:- start:714 stop:1586 length:873 start_codon:yes stop_codon:yes gene_type:complete